VQEKQQLQIEKIAQGRWVALSHDHLDHEQFAVAVIAWRQSRKTSSAFSSSQA